MTPRRIAAIVTCRDLGRYLDEALASVERQTRPAAEILVVDDASEDIHTRQVLAHVRFDGPKLRFLGKDDHINVDQSPASLS